MKKIEIINQLLEGNHLEQSELNEAIKLVNQLNKEIEQRTINQIFEDIRQRRGNHYVHAIEVEDRHALDATIEALMDEFIGNYTDKQIVQFWSTIEIYCLDDNYDFNIHEIIAEILENN